ncbi:MAG: peptidylprolyl isomerase [Planctomycetaceae bacterium]|nr:peptidylprolyl isomerase [Planctomycetaceae bacterium]
MDLQAIPQDGTYQVLFECSCGNFVVEVDRSWAPIGAERFYQLVKSGFFDDSGFFRVVRGFVVQFGLAADPDVTQHWNREIPDDPVRQSNKTGYLTYATKGAGTRTTQVFISLADNPTLDLQGFAPFGRVIEGMDAVSAITAQYGEGPNQNRIMSEGSAYLKREFPNLDRIVHATIVKDDAAPSGDDSGQNRGQE